MIKVFKIINKILLAIAVTLFCFSIIIPGITLEPIEMKYLSLVLANASIVIAAVVGAILIYSNNDIAKRVGHGFIVSAFVLGLAAALINLETTTTTEEIITPSMAETVESETSIAAVIMIIAAIVLALSYAFNLLIYILDKNSNDSLDPSENVRVIRIKEWKQLMEEGIITQEEYEEKRIQILGMKPKTEKKN